MSGKAAILMEDIKKTYDMGETQIFALKGVSLNIQEGEMVAIMGSSGSGKSTLLNLIGCLDRPTGGTYYLDGENVSDLDKDQLAAIRNKRLGFVFQGFNLLGRVSVLANVQLPLVYAGTGKKEMEDRAKEALAWVGLASYTRHYPSQMSGGQQQRVAIARALVNNPSLILADEPTGALDSKTSIEIISVIQRLNIEKGITVVMVTHEKDIALYCRRLINLKDGRIIGDEPVLNRRDAARDLSLLAEERGAAS
ncbi:ABC transporter ATP-binding protein [Pelotomaculum propionicicum]|uniref:Putative ABC transporter ATP-binding protein YknY n=1 Tax=Pelotomaculum propionicicum TaxID=258475 RepID=A0A4Y7RXP7_9FIRM|nr:ABC transporter ATP-binding protein [Pelotomaculum propionicicum]NLI13575.1 ABC transporter ATP-binding protein [Peptococcaceae bacterium]TEB13744.1 putative ABC transporter ATP-binding protein YknY [Pelotomaculum propionicicum]